MAYKQDYLRNLAEKYVNDPNTDFDTIKNNNITTQFYQQYKTYLTKGTLVNINFNGHTTDGKSTACATLVAYANTILKRQMKSTYILGNQQEYAYWVSTNPKETHLMVQVDEWSKLAETGSNATIEKTYLDELSNIHAQMYVHKATCSPHLLPDPNILLHFEVATKLEKEQKTVCYLYYNLSRGGQTFPQIIGHVVINVKETLNSTWYKEYRKNKFKKIKLLREHNIIHERELFYATPIKEITKSLIGYTQMGKYVSERTVSYKGQVYCAQHGIRLTMIGVKFSIVDPVKAILDIHTDVTRLLNEITKLKSTKDKNMETENRIRLLTQQYKSNINDINYYMKDLKEKEKLFTEYKKIKWEKHDKKHRHNKTHIQFHTTTKTHKQTNRHINKRKPTKLPIQKSNQKIKTHKNTTTHKPRLGRNPQNIHKSKKKRIHAKIQNISKTHILLNNIQTNRKKHNTKRNIHTKHYKKIHNRHTIKQKWYSH